jgi:hypothetical protein
VAALLVGFLTALLIRASQVTRPPCVAGLREQDCGAFTDSHIGLRWVIVSTAILIVAGLLIARHALRDSV